MRMAERASEAGAFLAATLDSLRIYQPPRQYGVDFDVKF